MLQLAKDLHQNKKTEENGAAQNNADPEEDFVSDDDDDFLNHGTIDDNDLEFLDLVRLELQMLRRMHKCTTLKEGQTALEWWKEVGSQNHPNLAKLALHILGIPGTQIECERLFSIAGILTRHRRTRTDADLVDTIMYVNHNYPDHHALPAVVESRDETEEQEEEEAIRILEEDSVSDSDGGDFSSEDEP